MLKFITLLTHFVQVVRNPFMHKVNNKSIKNLNLQVFMIYLKHRNVNHIDSACYQSNKKFRREEIRNCLR